MENRKEDIIIELGRQSVRVGLIGDKVPRKTIKPGALGVFNSELPLFQYEIKVEEVLYAIFYSYLNTSCLNKTIVLLEHVYTDRRIVEAMAKILFKKFKIERIEFGLSCITPLYLTGKFSGLVVLAGSSAVEIMPVYESYPLFSHFKNIPTGGYDMIKLIKDELIMNNPTTKPQIFPKITEQFLADLRNNYSNMNLINAENGETQQKTVTFLKSKLKLKPSNISYKNIYGNSDNEEYNIAYSLLEILQKIPIQMLEAVCSNIVLAGGLWRIKGMQTYFKKALKENFDKFERVSKLGVKQKIRFVNWGFNPSEVSWIGGSIGASIKSVEALSLKRVDYERTGFTQKVMEAYFLSD